VYGFKEGGLRGLKKKSGSVRGSPTAKETSFGFALGCCLRRALAGGAARVSASFPERWASGREKRDCTVFGEGGGG